MNTENMITKKICVMKNTNYGYEFQVEVDEFTNIPGLDTPTEVRISEVLEVSFPPRPPEEIIPVQVAAIDAAVAALFEKVQELREKKQELLSIGFDNSGVL